MELGGTELRNTLSSLEVFRPALSHPSFGIARHLPIGIDVGSGSARHVPSGIDVGSGGATHLPSGIGVGSGGVRSSC